MTLLFNNIYIYLFISLFVLDILLQIIIKKHTLQDDTSYLSLFKHLHKFKNHTISFSIFILLLYLSIVISPLLFIRIRRLGLVYDLPTLRDGIFDYKLYIPLIFILLSFIWILKITNYILYTYVLKLHFYLYYKSEYYIHTFTEYKFFKDPLLDDFCTRIMLFFYTLYKTNKKFIENYKFARKALLRVRKNPDDVKNKWFLYLYLRRYVNKYVLLKHLITYISLFFLHLSFYMTKFIYYLPYSLLFITLGYDITQGVITYTFYATLYLYITNLIKKVRKFYKEKDQLLDHKLATYFYNNVDAYNEFQVLLETPSKSSEPFLDSKYPYPEIMSIFLMKKELIAYINSDFVVDYLRRPMQAQNIIIVNNIYKRLNILMVLIIFNIYMLYNNKYILIIYNIPISLSIISITLLGLMYYLHRQIPEETEDSWVEYTTPKRIFYILLVISILFFGFLFLKNKLTLDPQEIIISCQDVITIKENFTLTDKFNYLKKYITYLKTNDSWDTNILEKIQKDIIENNLITIDMMFDEIKDLITNLYNKENTPLEITKKETFIEKLYKLITNKK